MVVVAFEKRKRVIVKVDQMRDWIVDQPKSTFRRTRMKWQSVSVPRRWSYGAVTFVSTSVTGMLGCLGWNLIDNLADKRWT